MANGRSRVESYVIPAIENLIWLLVVAALVLFSLLSGHFFTTYNLVNILPRVAALSILVVGQSFTMITGHFDLSSESAIGLTAMVGALLLATPTYGGLGTLVSPGVGVLAILVVGLMIGCFNGFMITKLRMNNLVTTIAMLILLRGLVLIISPGKSVSFFGKSFDWVGGGQLFQIGTVAVPVSLFFVLVVFALAHVVTRYTAFGRQMYAVGSNREAAEAAGIRTQRVIFSVYLISGFCSALAGWLIAGQQDAVVGSLGQHWIFQVQAAAIIGGVSLFGGRGTMIGALGGVLFWGTLQSGLSILGATPFTINIFQGALLLVAILLDSLKRRYLRNVGIRIALERSTIGLVDAGARRG